MCGICGIIKFNNSAVDETSIQKMMQKIKHRGPDDEGVFLENNVGLGFVRLSILDLSPAGHQPMLSGHQTPSAERLAKERYVIVYNGEVYNYIEIRAELIAQGYTFKSNTDTEVVLNSYIEWGEDCLEKFNGMWSFVIYDRQKKEIFCARDRYGIKPFYYYSDNERFIFASEIPPILTVLNKKPAANNQSIFDYLVFNRTDQTEQTFFSEIKKLQHGCFLSNRLSALSSQKIEIKKWYDLRERVKMSEGFQNADEYRELFSSAVGLRLRSDVPIGVCLSGGLDSSSIVSILLKDYNKKDLNTFSAVYEKGQIGDESDYINSYSSELSNMFYTTPSAESLDNDLMKFIKAHGEPIPSTSPYAQYKVMQLAKENVVVTLDGQGADEELAGYHYFFGFYFKHLLRKFKWTKLFSELFHYVSIHRSVYGVKTFLYLLLPKSFRTKLRLAEKGYLTKAFGSYNSHSVIADELYGSDSLQDSLLNHFEYKLEHLLKWEDRNSMHFSLEARVPFLDYRLVEKTLATSSDKLISKGMTKHILRRAMKGTLPEKIRVRKDKIGFGTPQDEWFRTEKFKRFIFDILSSDSFKNRNIIDIKKAKSLFRKHLNKKINISNEIWKWIHLELWFRHFLDE
jgi:asparagine synthase (glutamine-hydrolysing)